METAFLQQGKDFTPVDPSQINVLKILPPNTYSIAVTMTGQFYLEVTDNFTMPTKLYGDVHKTTDRIINTFQERPNNTGVLLAGEKGSGKTMLAKNIATVLQDKEDYITILVNNQLCGESFNSFLQTIQQPAVVLFDEFEKVYDADHQKQLLTIFDGVYSSKKLFILTCNSKHSIDNFMINRPGRLYYALDFKGLTEDFIKEYCADNLKNKTNIDGIFNVAKFFHEFSFDMLKALVEEMNRYDENATEAMAMLNINPEVGQYGVYDIFVIRNGHVLIHEDEREAINKSPISGKHSFWLRPRDLDDEPEGTEHGPNDIKKAERFIIDPTKLESLNTKGYDFIFSTDDPNTKIACKREVINTAAFNYASF